MTTRTISEIDIWADVIGQDGSGRMSAEEARAIQRWTLNEHARLRMGELARRNNNGQITDKEKEELRLYVHVGQVVGILQAQASIDAKELSQS